MSTLLHSNVILVTTIAIILVSSFLSPSIEVKERHSEYGTRMTSFAYIYIYFKENMYGHKQQNE